MTRMRLRLRTRRPAPSGIASLSPCTQAPHNRAGRSRFATAYRGIRRRCVSSGWAAISDRALAGPRVCFRAMRLLPLFAIAGLVLLATPTSADHPRSADEIIVAEVRRATEQYRDIARARAD